jgi:predicted small lipoprotein YifL
MLKKTRRLAAALGLALALTACGDDGPTTPTPPPADVAGSYWINWTLQVLRESDDFQTEFYCSGQLTLVQEAARGSVATLTGYAVVGSPCAPESYDLRGSVDANGAIQFTTDGPPPTEGPCPGGEDVRFSGQVTEQDGWHSLSARGVTSVSCPEFGAHEFTYLMNGGR